ncbi:hypothetical protein BDP27DRAFT_1424419 [Rhodocollybia butyracea]|uniref:Uncharacterized protein n=1 Tax=Rhodocollybia butyracea TaxID=206335 RepID=A0A9P5PM70_9AGAR|nr:hypothetical protein BDP27DRAFT_1424419 [Rhodocollybia butyracea]
MNIAHFEVMQKIAHGHEPKEALKTFYQVAHNAMLPAVDEAKVQMKDIQEAAEIAFCKSDLKCHLPTPTVITPSMSISNRGRAPMPEEPPYRLDFIRDAFKSHIKIHAVEPSIQDAATQGEVPPINSRSAHDATHNLPSDLPLIVPGGRFKMPMPRAAPVDTNTSTTSGKVFFS